MILCLSYFITTVSNQYKPKSGISLSLLMTSFSNVHSGPLSSGYCHNIWQIGIDLFLLRGRPQTTLTRRGRQVTQVVLEISTVCRFFLITAKEFCDKWQQGAGRWSIMGKILSTQFLNAPLYRVTLPWHENTQW